MLLLTPLVLLVSRLSSTIDLHVLSHALLELVHGRLPRSVGTGRHLIVILKSHRILLLMHESVVLTLDLINSWSKAAFNKYIILIINDLEASVGASAVSIFLSCESMGVA